MIGDNFIEATYNVHSFFFQNSRHKTYGFDLMTEDDKVFYPLAADSEAEMEEWTALLTRAIASEMDDTDGEGRRKWVAGTSVVTKIEILLCMNILD